MNYPGNASLAPEVQERILSSFEQTVDLAAQGNDREAKLGCEFILGMDPLFRPATTLLQRIQDGHNPPVVDDLFDAEEAAVDASPLVPPDPELDASPLVPPDPSSAGADALEDANFDNLDLDDLESFDDLKSLDDLDGLDADEAPAAPTSGLGAVLHDLLKRRNFEQVLQIAESQQEAITADPELQAMVARARDLQESGQFVENFLDSARALRDTGQEEEAAKLVDKARSLDPEHPSIAAFASAGDDGELLGAIDVDDPAEPAASELLSGVDDEFATGVLDLGGEDGLGEELAGITREPTAELAPEPAAEPASSTPDGDGDDRIGQLLAEGQEAFDRSDYQGALDVWSRIFLIDIDNAEASRRIEEARNRKAELERQAEEIFHEGLTQLESQELDAARESFAKVLELQPGHSVAREYLDQLEAGEVPTLTPSPDVSGPATDELEAVDTEDDATPSLEAAVQRDRVVAVKRTDRRLIALGAVVLVLLVVGGGFLFTRWDDLFPNAGDTADGVAQPPTALVRANALHDQGKTTAAIRVLEGIPADNPLYDQAQALLAQWRALIEAPPAPEPVDTGPSEAELERRRRLIGAAREMVAGSQHIRARRYLIRAEQIAPLEGEDQELANRIALALQPLEDELRRFEDGDWERLIPDLWRKLDQEPGHPDVELLIVESYYGLGLRALQRNEPAKGVDLLREAVALAPENEPLTRVLLFAETYAERPNDLLYRIFVKYLPARP